MRRRLTSAHVPLLGRVLHDEMVRYPAERVAPQWRDELAAIGPREHPALETDEGFELALGLCAELCSLPPIPRLLPPPGEADPLAAAQARTSEGGQHAKILARVRALLAKAESTEFSDEAEALSAKAQELISRHSLDQLLATSSHTGGCATAADVVARRFWIDAPYVGAGMSSGRSNGVGSRGCFQERVQLHRRGL